MIRCTAFLWEAELQKDLMESSWPSWPSRWAPLPPYSSSGLQDGLTAPGTATCAVQHSWLCQDFQITAVVRCRVFRCACPCWTDFEFCRREHRPFSNEYCAAEMTSLLSSYVALVLICQLELSLNNAMFDYLQDISDECF